LIIYNKKIIGIKALIKMLEYNDEAMTKIRNWQRKEQKRKEIKA